MGDVTQRCKQCGELQDSNNFRPYYNRRSGRNKVCKTCEKINNRYKYLDTKKDRNTTESEEYDAIQLLYEAQRAAGLRPPLVEKKQDDIMSLVKAKMTVVEPLAEVGEGAPYDLTRWLTESLGNYSPGTLDDMYDKLEQRYSPIVGIDTNTGLPLRDTRYKTTLNKVLNRFMDYEDEYYSEDK